MEKDLTVDASALEPFTVNNETFFPVPTQVKYPHGSCIGCSVAYRKNLSNIKTYSAFHAACYAAIATIQRKNHRMNVWEQDGNHPNGTITNRAVCGDVIWVVDMEAYLKAKLAGERYGGK